MSDADLIERLEDVLAAVERIPRRFAGVASAAAKKAEIGWTRFAWSWSPLVKP